MHASTASSIDGSYRTYNQKDPLESTCDAVGPTTTSSPGPRLPVDDLTSEATSMQRHTRKPFRRDAGRIAQWVLDQQNLTQEDSPPDIPTEQPPAPSSQCHPYLAYQYLNPPSVKPPSCIDGSSTECFVLVEEPDDYPGSVVSSQKTQRTSRPTSPRTPRKSLGMGSTISAGNEPPASALRSFHLGFPSHSRKPSNTTTTTTTRSPSPSRSSLFRRPDTQSSYTPHSSFTPSVFSPKPTRATPTEFGSVSHAHGSTTWKIKRPAVLGHFLTPAEGQNDAHLPRPSTSSSFTHSSTTFTQPSTDTLNTPPKMSMGHSPSPTSFFRSSHSLWSLPTTATHIYDPPNSTKVIARDRESERSAFRASMRSSTSSPLHLLGSPKKRKKRKLIISGIPHGDHTRLEAVKAWCETFGQVNQITRVHNGDLHIDFRKNEVADTVCRLNARVHISGVGSVGLSWFTGKKP